MRFILTFLISIFYCTASFSQPKTSDFIDANSRIVVRVEAINSKYNINLWSGTAFFISVKNDVYLITNDHILGGKWMQAEYLRDSGKTYPQDKLPDILRVIVYDSILGTFYQNSIRIRDKKTNDIKWIQFWEDELRQKDLLDVAAITLREPFALKSSVVLTVSNNPRELHLYNGLDLFVVGFPASDSGLFVSPYPIWKKGTIASDPNFINAGISEFFIDATTRPGMSGSPVFFRSYSVPKKFGDYSTTNSLYTLLVGIYNSQFPKHELGVVIRIEKIIQKLMILP